MRGIDIGVARRSVLRFAIVSYLIYRLTFFQQIFITFWSHSIYLTTKPFTAFRLASGLSDPRLISSARSENVIHSSCRRFNLIDYFPKRLFVEHKLFALVFIIFCSNLPDSLLILIFHVLILMSLYKYVCTEVWINTNTRIHAHIEFYSIYTVNLIYNLILSKLIIKTSYKYKWYIMLANSMLIRSSHLFSGNRKSIFASHAVFSQFALSETHQNSSVYLIVYLLSIYHVWCDLSLLKKWSKHHQRARSTASIILWNVTVSSPAKDLSWATSGRERRLLRRRRNRSSK